MKTVLSIGAHPDDIEIGCGGTEALLHQQGYRIIHVIITNGEEGGININKQELIHIRELEANNSAKLIGAEEVVLLGYEDSLTSYTKAMKTQLITLIRQYKPEIVFTHVSNDYFPDHQIVHQLVMASVTAAAGPWFPEVSDQPHDVAHIYGYEVWHPIQQYQLIVAIDSVIDIKFQALNCHQSQIKEIDYMSAVKGLALYRGAMSRKSKHAEAFEVLKTTLYPA